MDTASCICSKLRPSVGSKFIRPAGSLVPRDIRNQKHRQRGTYGSMFSREEAEIYREDRIFTHSRQECLSLFDWVLSYGGFNSRSSHRPSFDSDTPDTVYQARVSKYHYSSTAVANDTYLGQIRTNGVVAHTISEPYQPPSAPTNLSVRGNQNFLGADPGIRPSFRLGSLAEQPFVRMRITQWTAFSDHDESGWISMTAVPPLSVYLLWVRNGPSVDALAPGVGGTDVEIGLTPPLLQNCQS
ncbi:uncharacterized protein BT62DRAFT_1080740 [Guyanagaster necrorhizus]|uniref:Uncharacterized protein n=1 Tax=Guyanagaster necrorhizus TaxID=856835 RepID=A0A9P7VGK4_9AGAR|nr:uncharacterized protein BT62DRAFT_1080740 [Guyanagaster necrorhizus MCA 3950]KAG7440611.1 hypothetical protein BT62DRAFT_1080740 [Guyanagaster necrorhizus MCA 3950]